VLDVIPADADCVAVVCDVEISVLSEEDPIDAKELVDETVPTVVELPADGPGVVVDAVQALLR
jgi:hypothetical protein